MFKPIRSCIFAGALACALTGTVLAAGPLKPVDNPAPIAAKGIGQTQALNAVKNAAQLRKFRVVSTHGNVVKLAYPSRLFTARRGCGRCKRTGHRLRTGLRNRQFCFGIGAPGSD